MDVGQDYEMYEQEVNWEPWNFGLCYVDFWDLMIVFNTVPSSIQTYGSICDDFEHIAHTTFTLQELRDALLQHRKQQLSRHQTLSGKLKINLVKARTKGKFQWKFGSFLDLLSQDSEGDRSSRLPQSWQSPTSLQ